MLRHVFVSAVLLTVLSPTGGSGQSANAVAGWVALITTPVGAFAPSAYVAPASPSDRRWGAQARYSHWQFAQDDDNTTNLGVGLGFALREGRVGFDIGRTTKKDCDDCDALMFGGTLVLPLKTAPSGLALTLSPEIGYMTDSGDSDFSSMAAAVNLSLSYPVAMGDNAKVIPFVSPGAGMGRVSGGGDSESGQRLLLGGGISMINTRTGLQVTASASRIFIDGGATVLGITLGLGR